VRYPVDLARRRDDPTGSRAGAGDVTGLLPGIPAVSVELAADVGVGSETGVADRRNRVVDISAVHGDVVSAVQD